MKDIEWHSIDEFPKEDPPYMCLLQESVPEDEGELISIALARYVNLVPTMKPRPHRANYGSAWIINDPINRNWVDCHFNPVAFAYIQEAITDEFDSLGWSDIREVNVHEGDSYLITDMPGHEGIMNDHVAVGCMINDTWYIGKLDARHPCHFTPTYIIDFHASEFKKIKKSKLSIGDYVHAVGGEFTGDRGKIIAKGLSVGTVIVLWEKLIDRACVYQLDALNRASK